MGIRKSWSETIKPHLKRITKQSNAIFAAFEKEKKKKNIKTIYENNALWNKKYKSKFNALEKRQDREYKIIWDRYIKSGGSFK